MNPRHESNAVNQISCIHEPNKKNPPKSWRVFCCAKLQCLASLQLTLLRQGFNALFKRGVTAEQGHHTAFARNA